MFNTISIYQTMDDTPHSRHILGFALGIRRSEHLCKSKTGATSNYCIFGFLDSYMHPRKTNFDTIEKEDAKEKTEFWHTEAFRTYVLIRVRLYRKHREKNIGKADNL